MSLQQGISSCSACTSQSHPQALNTTDGGAIRDKKVEMDGELFQADILICLLSPMINLTDYL